ncbi:golgin subfamily A member 6-like protein 22 [Arapaima gigas]
MDPQPTNSWGAEAICPPRLCSPSLRVSSPLTISHLDVWDKRTNFKGKSSTCRTEANLIGQGSFSISSSRASKFATSQKASLSLRRWKSLSYLTQDGALQVLLSSTGAELRAALVESRACRATLVQRLWEVQIQLDKQTEQLRAWETQLQHSWTSTELLELRHRQLAESVRALEQQKDAAVLCLFKETQQRGELQEK